MSVDSVFVDLTKNNLCLGDLVPQCRPPIGAARTPVVQTRVVFLYSQSDGLGLVALFYGGINNDDTAAFLCAA